MIAIKVAELLAFAAMAEIKVKVIENPVDPRNVVSKKSPVSFTGLPATKAKKAKAIPDSIRSRNWL